MLKRYLFFISILYTLVLTFVCLITLKELPDVGVSFADKIFHSVIYLLLVLLWYNTLIYKFHFTVLKALWFSAICSIIFGIVIEALQGMVTVTRKPDFYDVIANTLGVVLAVVLVLLKNTMRIKK